MSVREDDGELPATLRHLFRQHLTDRHGCSGAAAKIIVRGVRGMW